MLTQAACGLLLLCHNLYLHHHMDHEQYGCSYYNLIFIIILSTNIFLYWLDYWEVLDVCWKRGCWYSWALNLDALAEFLCWHTWVRFIVFSLQPPFSTGEKHKSAPTLPSVSGSQPTIWWISNLAQFTQLEYEVQYYSLEYFWKVQKLKSRITKIISGYFQPLAVICVEWRQSPKILLCYCWQKVNQGFKK